MAGVNVALRAVFLPCLGGGGGWVRGGWVGGDACGVGWGCAGWFGLWRCVAVCFCSVRSGGWVVRVRLRYERGVGACATRLLTSVGLRYALARSP